MIEAECDQCHKTFEKGELWGIRRPNYPDKRPPQEISDELTKFAQMPEKEQEERLAYIDKNPPEWVDMWVCKTCHKFFVEFDNADENTKTQMQLQFMQNASKNPDYNDKEEESK